MLQHLLNFLFHVDWMSALPVDPLTGGASMKYPMGVKHKFRNPALGLSPRHGLQFFIAKEAPRKEFSRIHLESQRLQDSPDLKIRLVFRDDDNVSQKKLGLEPSIPGEDDPFFLLGYLNKAMEIPPWIDSGVKTEGSQPSGEFSQGRVNDESLFHSIGRPASKDQTQPVWRLP